MNRKMKKLHQRQKITFDHNEVEQNDVAITRQIHEKIQRNNNTISHNQN